MLALKVKPRRTVLSSQQYNDGRIILIGIRCQIRAQAHGPYKFLLNALLYSENKSP